MALVTRGTDAIVYGTFQGSLFGETFVNEKEGFDDGFVMGLDFAP